MLQDDGLEPVKVLGRRDALISIEVGTSCLRRCENCHARLPRNRSDLLTFGFVVLHNFRHCLAQVFFAGHVVPGKHGVGFPASHPENNQAELRL